MTLDIVIVNYKTANDLDLCLQSLDRYPPTVPYNLYVVNNDPGPIDLQVAKRHMGGPDRMHLHFGNLGYGKACNVAARFGQNNIIGFFNADVEFTEGTLDACHHALASNAAKQWAILGPRQINRAGKITHAGIFGTQREPKHRGWKASSGYVDIRDDAVTVAGSAYFIVREVFEELADCPTFRAHSPTAMGAFLPTPHYYEETWCSYHAAAHGYKVVYFGARTMIHEWHQASPVGGPAEKGMPAAQQMFRAACDHHRIPHD